VSSEGTRAGGVERLDLGVERLELRFRFTWAFHAREVRFEQDAGDGFAAAFPETFSFHAERHDPTELQLQLEDLWSNPRRLGARATRRDAEDLVRRLLSAAPRYVERVLDRLEAQGQLSEEPRLRVYGDAAVLARVLARFLAEKGLEQDPATRLAALHLRKLVWRTAWALVRTRVPPEALEAHLGAAQDLSPGEDLSEAALVRALADRDAARLEPLLLALAGHAFHRWVEDVCLDESNGAFEAEGSPFADRETEILQAIGGEPARAIRLGRDLSPFLRRSANRDCLRVLRRLELWFLHQYDIPHASAVIRHAAGLARGRNDADRVLSLHSTRNYLLSIGVLTLPFLGATFAYERAPRFFDLICSGEILVAFAAALWFLLYQFCWKKDLVFFHAAVPRIGAGIIVGYLPVFLIDEVWDLARRPWFPLGVVVILLGFTTLLYLYLEVQRRIRDPREAFARARRIFFLGVLQAQALGLIVTSLLGPFMVSRTWGDEGASVSLTLLRAETPPFLGELPRILGVEPVLAFPTAVILMTVLSFFIGTFLQLMWEDLPITEPL
jgi:hypothetical protein